MSRIGNTPVRIPEGAAVTIDGRNLVVRGPKGEIVRSIPEGIKVTVEGSIATIAAPGSDRDKKKRALHGLVRALLANDVEGVTRGWSKTLELSGVGFRAVLSGSDLVLTVGFSHPVTIKPPTGITFSVAEGTVVVTGVDKGLVGQLAANVRAVKKPEPYKGKGIKYKGEYIRKKAGKAAKAIGGTTAAAGK